MHRSESLNDVKLRAGLVVGCARAGANVAGGEAHPVRTAQRAEPIAKECIFPQNAIAGSLVSALDSEYRMAINIT